MDGYGRAGRRAATGGREDRSAEVERPRGGRGRHRNGVAVPRQVVSARS